MTDCFRRGEGRGKKTRKRERGSVNIPFLFEKKRRKKRSCK